MVSENDMYGQVLLLDKYEMVNSEDIELPIMVEDKSTFQELKVYLQDDYSVTVYFELPPCTEI